MKKAGSPWGVRLDSVCRRAGSALDLAGLEARGADIETLRGHTRVTDQSLDPLDVGVPATLGAAVRVRDVVTEARSLAADIAVGSHGCSPEIDVTNLGGGPAHLASGASQRRRGSREPVKSSRGEGQRPKWAASGLLTPAGTSLPPCSKPCLPPMPGDGRCSPGPPSPPGGPRSTRSTSTPCPTATPAPTSISVSTPPSTPCGPTTSR